MIGAEMVCFDYPSEFFKINHRDGALNEIAKNIHAECLKTDAPIYTHNAWGEYGHLDHVLVNQIACSFAKRTGRQVFSSGIVEDAGWFDVVDLYQDRPGVDCQNDLDLYYRCQGVYIKHGCWTWSRNPIKTARLCEI